MFMRSMNGKIVKSNEYMRKIISPADRKKKKKLFLDKKSYISNESVFKLYFKRKYIILFSRRSYRIHEQHTNYYNIIRPKT